MKKALITVMLAAVLICTVLPIFSASAAIGPQYVYTQNGKSLNIRAWPSTNADIIGHIPYGARVTNLEYHDGSWLYVTYNGVSGYCMTRYFQSQQPAPRPTSKPTSKPTRTPATGLFNGFSKADYYVTVRPTVPSGFVNMRWAPSTNYDVQTIYYQGYQLRVISQNSVWAQVFDEKNAICGFIMREFLTPTGYGSASQAVGTSNDAAGKSAAAPSESGGGNG